MSTNRSVVHLSATDNEGGSGRSAYRIHTGLRNLGWRSRMLVGLQVTQDPDVQTVHGGGRLTRVAGRWVDRATRRFGLAYQWQLWGSRLARHTWLQETDIIQLFNLHGGYFPIRLLPEMSRHAPLVWRLSDMWPMTGHCVYSGDCERWKTGCGECPTTHEYVELGIDTTAFLWRQKDRLYADCDITVVAPSSWTERLARESPLLGRFPVHRIPNGLDVETFHPMSRETACEALGYDPAIRRLIFVAHGLDDNPRKGGDALMEALRQMGPRPGVELLLAGVGGESWEHAGLPIPVRRVGYIRDDKRMAMIYAAADIIVVPSAVENLPNTLLEAMACGLPAVAIQTGGMADAIREGETGYLVAKGDIAGLATRLGMLLDNESTRQRMGVAGRQLIEREFSNGIQAERFSGLYQQILEQRGSSRK
jgi:glycosyltransferase involved in cell wall biosynthesis